MGDRPNPNKGRSMVPVNHALKYTEEDMVRTVEFAKRNARGNFLKEIGITELNSGSTPSSRWFAEGGEDAFPEMINQERGSLCLGNMTDDELAFAVFVYGNMGEREKTHAILNGGITDIMYLMAAKERIRWLSRHLEKSLREQRSQRTAIWNFIIDEYGSRGEDALLAACDALMLPREYAMARLYPERETVKEE